jgi:hypothetical protein
MQVTNFESIRSKENYKLAVIWPFIATKYSKMPGSRCSCGAPKSFRFKQECKERKLREGNRNSLQHVTSPYTYLHQTCHCLCFIGTSQECFQLEVCDVDFSDSQSLREFKDISWRQVPENGKIRHANSHKVQKRDKKLRTLVGNTKENSSTFL